MRMKKVIALMLVLTLTLSCFTACGKKKETADSTDVQAAATNAPAATTAADSATAAPTAAASALEPMTTDNITLKVAVWGQGEKGEPEAKDAQIKAFMEKYPNIKVEFVEIDQTKWADSLTSLAATGQLPDVFGVFSVTDAIMNQWALDVTDYAAKDPDTQEIYPSMLNNAKINGKLYSMPWEMFPCLVFVNKTLFEKYNVELPSYDWTVDDFKAIAQKITHPEDFNFGTSNPIYTDYFPALYDGTSQYGWDGTNYNYGQSWIDALNLKYEFIDKKVCEWASAEDKKKYLGDEGAWPPGYGRSAMHWDWTWTIAYFEDTAKKQSGCDFAYYPQPKGPSGKQMAICDYSIISASTKYPREAWELQKWMTWGKEACLNRLEGYKTAGLTVASRMPVINNQEVWDAYKAFTNRDDMKEVYSRLTDVVPSVSSVAPGYSDFDKWCTDNNIWTQLDNREKTPADLADTLTKKANEFKDQWIANLPQ